MKISCLTYQAQHFIPRTRKINIEELDCDVSVYVCKVDEQQSADGGGMVIEGIGVGSYT